VIIYNSFFSLLVFWHQWHDIHFNLADSSTGEKAEGWEVCQESQSQDEEEDARAVKSIGA